jgi:hypothetical protein
MTTVFKEITVLGATGVDGIKAQSIVKVVEY